MSSIANDILSRLSQQIFCDQVWQIGAKLGKNINGYFVHLVGKFRKVNFVLMIILLKLRITLYKDVITFILKYEIYVCK